MSSLTLLAIARGMAAVIAVILGMLLIPWPIMLSRYSIPVFLQNVAIVWPQYLFFGESLVRVAGGRIVPYAWTGHFNLGFWSAAALVFGIMTRRVKSRVVVFALAPIFVAGVVGLVYSCAWMMNWRFSLDFP